MLAEWNAECSADAPTVVVPWSDAASGMHYVDLRAEPYDIVEISEAEHFPALSRSLRSLNALSSPLLTSKCDVWLLSEEENEDELETVRIECDLLPEEATHGVSSYIDFLWRDRTVFGSSHQQQEFLDRLIRRAERLAQPEAMLSCVLRPAIYDGVMPLEGYAVTLYIRAVAADPGTAMERWGNTLAEVTTLLRSRELAPTRTSATID